MGLNREGDFRSLGSDNRRGVVMLVSAVVLWSTIEVVSKAISGVEPLAIAFVRFSTGALLLSPVWLRRLGDVSFRREVRTILPGLSASALVGITLTFSLFHYSLLYIPAYTAATVISAVPLFVLPLSLLSLGERPGGRAAAGVGMGVLGIFILVMGSGLEGDQFIGVLLVLASAFCFSVFTVWNRRFSMMVDVGCTTSLTLAIGAVLFIPLLFLHRPTGGYSISSSEWVVLLYLGLAATGLGYMLYFKGLQTLETHRGVSVFFLKPVASIILAFLVLKDPIGLLSLAGVLVVVASMKLVFR